MTLMIKDEYYTIFLASIAQLDRVPGYEPGGQRFKSSSMRFNLNKEVFMFNLIGKPAPHFSVSAVEKNEIKNDFSLNTFFGKYVIFFFYPLDFTFVCPTELHAFQAALNELKSKNAVVVGCSTDSCYSHLAWLRMPKKEGGIQGIEFPIVSDFNKDISRKYGVLKEEDGVAYRGLFLIDKQGIIRHFLVNDLSLGRSVQEVIRLLDALIFVETHGEVCPANWSEGDKGLVPTDDGIKKFFN